MALAPSVEFDIIGDAQARGLHFDRRRIVLAFKFYTEQRHYLECVANSETCLAFDGSTAPADPNIVRMAREMLEWKAALKQMPLDERIEAYAQRDEALRQIKRAARNRRDKARKKRRKAELRALLE